MAAPLNRRPRPSRITRRLSGERFMILVLISFVVSLVGIREYLSLTGYPQVGGGELHIAHMLWGGLALIVAAMLPLLAVGRPVMVLTALLAGGGTGLFIDEIGKFITKSNDYFYPAAAPIIYGFLLVLVLVYFVIRRGQRPSPQTELHAALDELADVIDRRLSPAGYTQLLDRLDRIAANPSDLELAALAAGLRNGAASVQAASRVGGQDVWERTTTRLSAAIGHRSTRGVRRLLLLGLIVSGLGWLVSLLPFALADEATLQSMLAQIAATSAKVELPTELFWYRVQAGLGALIAVCLLTGSAAILAHRDGLGIRLALAGLALALTGGALLSLYLSQVSAITATLVTAGLLGLAMEYRRRVEAVA